jgi:hypothetical protein
MPEFRVWIVAGTCVLLVAVVAAFGGKKKIVDSLVTVIATFLGVFRASQSTQLTTES